MNNPKNMKELLLDITIGKDARIKNKLISEQLEDKHKLRILKSCEDGIIPDLNYRPNEKIYGIDLLYAGFYNNYKPDYESELSNKIDFNNHKEFIELLNKMINENEDIQEFELPFKKIRINIKYDKNTKSIKYYLVNGKI